MKLNVGDTFPDISLPDADGNDVRIRDRLGGGLVVYFYPADDTPGCTAQACSFRDAFEDFKEAGADVIGISSDTPEKHQAFAKRHRLPFTLLCDEGGKVRKEIGVPKSLGIIEGRVTYVLDSDGKIIHIFNSQIQATKHIQEALQALQAA